MSCVMRFWFTRHTGEETGLEGRGNGGRAGFPIQIFLPSLPLTHLMWIFLDPSKLRQVKVKFHSLIQHLLVQCQ